jgi:A/G-specific adenine glycosylase
MLQQTRVTAVLEHYARWMERLPTVWELAKALEQTVLAVWSGLGYYHRARRLHEAAKVIVREHKGECPQTAEGWRELPGIGRYTAAAIASIAFGESIAVVDGNVERVLDRVFGIHESSSEHWARAETLLDRERPGDFNQAMMELGATVCTPKPPQCLVCPLVTWCTTRGAGEPKPQGARKQKLVHYALMRDGKKILLVQRPSDAKRMAGMWELPEVAAGISVPTLAKRWRTWGTATPLARFRHSITDTDYEVAVVEAPAELGKSLNGDTRWCTRRQWEKLALTGLTRKILRKLGDAT